MAEKHPNMGYLAIQQLVSSGMYDKSWLDGYRAVADKTVKTNTDAYGKECGS